MSSAQPIIKQTTSFMTPSSLDEAMNFAKLLSQSTIVPKDYQGNPGNVLVAIQWGMELGLQPLQAMQNIAVINGRPSIWGDAMLAIVRGSKAFESMSEDITDSLATCTIKRIGSDPIARTFSLEDAKKAQLTTKQGPWTQYPKRMMQMRARAWALRDAFPDVLRGIAIAEEAQDIPVGERDMGPAVVVEQSSVVTDINERVRNSRPPPPAEPPRTPEPPAAVADTAPPAATEQPKKEPPTEQPTPPPEAVTDNLTTVLAWFKAARSSKELQDAGSSEEASKLTGDERKQAVAAWKKRTAELADVTQPVVDTETGEIPGLD